MSGDERATVAALDRCRSISRTCIDSHQGRVVDTAGDSILALFGTAVGAVGAALDIQDQINSLEVVPEERRMQFRIGIHLGDVIEKADGTIYGDGVNIAARLEGLAEPGGITVSDAVQGAVRGKVTASFVDLGEQQMKNISHPVRAFAARPSSDLVRQKMPIAGNVGPPLPDKPSIAVLPFVNMSGDSEQEYFADGIVEEIITGLSRFSSLLVIAHHSSFTYKGQAIDVTQIGHELGVRYVLQGSVRKAGEKVRIAAQLIEAAKGGHMWAERYDGDLKDIFTLQDDIARRIVGTIAPEIVLAEQSRIGRMPLHALRAYDLAMQSLSWCRRGEYTNDRTLIEKAVELANSAVSIDASSVPACYALGEALSHLAELARLRGEKPALLDKAAAVAETLRDLDPTNHAGYYLIGHAAIRRRRAAEGLSNLRRAHELNPNDCRALQYLAWAEFNLGFASEARAHAELALRLSPRDPQRYISYWVLAFAAFIADSPKDGAAWAKRAVEENATFFHGHGVLAACLAESGQLEAAQSEIAYLLRHAPIYIRGRLAGDNYFGLPELGARFTSALRKAAGSLLSQIDAPE
jgi:adenylate cyclase